jgi:transposase, IS5 family
VARAAARQISFADVELMRQGVRLEPLLEVISKFLDSQHEIIERVRRDLVRGLKKPRKGRRGLTAPQVLRSLVLMRVKNWDYRELRERIADGVTLRQFTDFYCDPVPKHDAFNRGFNRLTPQTLKTVNDLVVQAAVGLSLEDGAKLRVDTTVVETDIHHPTDNTLLWDVVRVVTRLIGRLAKRLKMRRIKGFHDHRRSAHRRMYEIQRMTTRQRQDRQTTIYRALIGIAEEVVASAKTALEKTATMRGKDLFAAMAIDAIRDEIAHYSALGERVIDQARRRILEGEQVPNAEKIYSIFEPHTDLIKRGKVRTPMEFGHKVFLAESAKGLITQYEVLKGNPVDEVHVAPSLRRHRRTFRRAPELYGADRGFFSEQNIAACVHGRRQDSMYSPARRQQNATTPSLRKIGGIQARPALSRRHRGTHLCADARSRHEALPCPRRRALRVVCRRGGARQQPYDPCPVADQTFVAPTNGRAIASASHQRKWNKSHRPSSHL